MKSPVRKLLDRLSQISPLLGLLFILFFIAMPAQSQTGNLEWVKTFAKTGPFASGYASPYDLKIDNTGSVITTGIFTDTYDFDPGAGSFNLDFANGQGYIAKLSASGDFSWVKQIGNQFDITPYSIAIDNSQNILVTGGFTGTVDFDPSPAGVTNLSGGGLFILKLDLDGNFVWVKRLNLLSSTYETIQVATDAGGNVFATGGFGSTVDFNPGIGEFTITPSSGNTIYVLKLDANGDFAWVKTLDCSCPSLPNTSTLDITLDASGNILTTGHFGNTLDFDPSSGVTTLSPASGFFDDIFIWKLNANGDFVWVRQAGGEGFDRGENISTDNAGNVYISGTDQLVQGGPIRPFIQKLNADGTSLWVNTFSNYLTFTSSVADANGHVYFTGASNAQGDLDPSPEGSFFLQASSFVSRFSSSGSFEWAIPSVQTFFGGGTGYSYLIQTDANENFYTAGSYKNGEVDFDPSASELRLASNSSIADPFIQKLRINGVLSITSFTPTSGAVGTQVEIKGNNFGSTNANNIVRFNGTLALATASTAGSITTTVPAGAATGLITVTVGGNTATSATNFTVTTPVPTIISFTPASGPVGTSVVITGTNFSTTNANNIVKFNGITALATASTATSITTTVPTGATTGLITVTVGGNTATSATNFTVTTPLPTIVSFAPASGPVGTSVVITGTNFSTTSANNMVRFNGTTALATASTATSITTTVPTGATTGLITVTVGGNTATSATNFTVTTPLPTIVSFAPASGPVGTSVVITGTNFSTTSANNMVMFNGTTAVATASTTTSITTTVPSGATTGPITVTVGGNTATSTTDFTVFSTISITQQPSDIAVCVGQEVTFTTQASGANNIAYRWQYSPDGIVPFADIPNGNGYSNATTATLSINTTGNFGAGRYRCVVNGDLAQAITTQDKSLVVNPLSIAPTVAEASRCGNGNVSLTASGGVNGQYKWYTSATGQTAIASQFNSEFTTPSLSATTTYYVSLTTNDCESVRTPVVATINITPGPNATGASGCLGSSLVLTATGGANGQYRWYTSATGGTPLPGETNANFTTPAIAATTIYFVSVINANCESARIPAAATLLTTGCAPVISTQPLVTQVEGIVTLSLLPLITTVGTLDIASLKVISQPRSGAVATITNGILTIDYSSKRAFSGMDLLVIEACNTNGICSQQSFSVEVISEVVVYNAVSPNGDSKNEFLRLQYIEALSPQNKVTIFNRWGDQVFAVDDYDNASKIFSGLTNDGSLLPAGTYFYKVALYNTGKMLIGFFALRY